MYASSSESNMSYLAENLAASPAADARVIAGAARLPLPPLEPFHLKSLMHCSVTFSSPTITS